MRRFGLMSSFATAAVAAALLSVSGALEPAIHHRPLHKQAKAPKPRKPPRENKVNRLKGVRP